MRIYARILSLGVVLTTACTQPKTSTLQNADATEYSGIEELSGEIKDFYCGGLEAYRSTDPGYLQSDRNENKPLDGKCVFMIETSELEKIAVIASSNSWLTQFVPYEESHEIVVGRQARFEGCEVPGEELMEKIRSADWPSTFSFARCYERSTELPISNELMITPETVQGNYSNGRGDKAQVTVEIIFEATDSTPAVYDVYVEYTKADTSTAYIDFESDDLQWYNNQTRPYFKAYFEDDCDSPDCYNTDGTVKFLKNRSGTFTLFMELMHYNNSPMEYGDERDFWDMVWLKKD